MSQRRSPAGLENGVDGKRFNLFVPLLKTQKNRHPVAAFSGAGLPAFWWAYRLWRRPASSRGQLKLLDLRFFVDHVLAHYGIEFLDLHFVGHRALVLVGCVEVTSLGAGN